jgi:hypothetical protein
MANSYEDGYFEPIDLVYNRVAKAIDEHEWEGEFSQADFLHEELRYIKELRDKGELYVATF